MSFQDFARSIANKYVFCESYDERDAFVNYFSENGVRPDNTLHREMRSECDRWLHPYYDPYDNEVHAVAWLDEPNEDCIRFSDIAHVICTKSIEELDVPDLVGLLV